LFSSRIVRACTGCSLKSIQVKAPLFRAAKGNMVQESSPFSDAVSRALLVSTPEAILVVDSNGVIVLVNSQTEELLHYGRNELLGLHLDALVPELFREENLQQISAHTHAAERRPPRVELELPVRCKGGQQLLLAMSVCSVNVQDGPLVCCILRELAGPKRSDQAFDETCERFCLIVENSQDVLHPQR
jgi:PAS domain S-box-containing protein